MVPVGIGAVMNCAKALGMAVQKAGTIGIIPAGRRFTVQDRATTRVPLQWEALTLTLTLTLTLMALNLSAALASFAGTRATPKKPVPITIHLRRKIFTLGMLQAAASPLFLAEDAIVDCTELCKV